MRKFLWALILFPLLIAGCKTGSLSFDNPGASTLYNEAVQQGKIIDRIDPRHNSIEDAAKFIEKTSQNPEVRESAGIIQREIVIIRDEMGILKETNKKLENAAQDFEKLAKENQELKSEGSAEARQNLFRILGIIFALGAAAIIGGVIIAFYNGKMGMMIVGIGLITTAIAAAGTYYLQWIAIAGIIIAGVGLLATLIILIRGALDAKVEKESNEANIKIMEVMKADLPEDTKNKVFGGNGKSGIAEVIQTKPVKKKVAKVRSRIKNEV
jgi:hypothetical protein